MLQMMKQQPLFKKAVILALLTIIIGCFFTWLGLHQLEDNAESYAYLDIKEQIRQEFLLYEEKMNESYGFVSANDGQLTEESFEEMMLLNFQMFDVVFYAENGILTYTNNIDYGDDLGDEIAQSLSEDERLTYLESLKSKEIYIVESDDMLYFHQGFFSGDELTSVLLYGFQVGKSGMIHYTNEKDTYSLYLLDSYGNPYGDGPTTFDEILMIDTNLMNITLGLVHERGNQFFYAYMSILIGLFFVLSSGLVIRYFYLQSKKSSEYLSLLQDQARLHRVTRLFNANQLYSDVDELMEKDTPFYFALGHLNNIKVINDRFGHHLGDKLLSKISKLMLNVLPKDFKIYHIGGDDYVVIGLNKTSSHFANTLKRVLGVFDEDIIIDHIRMNLSMTFGVVHYPSDGKSTEQLINNAHITMRDVLNNNQNTFYFYEASKYMRRIEIDDFDQYVKRLDIRSLQLSFMPMVRTSTNEIVAFECLSRLYDEFNQLIPTEKLIDSLERIGRIQELDELVFEKTLEMKKKFEKRFKEDVVLSVNASAMSFNESFVDKVIRLKKESAIKGVIVIELTESYRVEDYEYLLKLFKRLNKEGIEIGIDDFGSGYSSIGYIAKFPLYAIKVDKRFVRDYKDSLFNQTLLKTLISICDVLGSRLVAEGVDTHETLAFLKEHKCPFYQGYLFHKGVSETEVMNLYKKHRQINDL